MLSAVQISTLMMYSSTGDLLNGSGGNDSLAGGNGKDLLDSGTDNDILNGNTGNNVLLGGSGKDVFIFNSPLQHTFNSGDDIIKLENKVFVALTNTGILNVNNFIIANPATDNNDYIIYNQTTGALFYDTDGNGANLAVQIAVLGTGLTLMSLFNKKTNRAFNASDADTRMLFMSVFAAPLTWCWAFHLFRLWNA